MYAISDINLKQLEVTPKLEIFDVSTGIPRFMLLMWGTNKKTTEIKNRIHKGYSVVLKWEENRIEL